MTRNTGAVITGYYFYCMWMSLSSHIEKGLEEFTVCPRTVIHKLFCLWPFNTKQCQLATLNYRLHESWVVQSETKRVNKKVLEVALCNIKLYSKWKKQRVEKRRKNLTNFVQENLFQLFLVSYLLTISCPLDSSQDSISGISPQVGNPCPKDMFSFYMCKCFYLQGCSMFLMEFCIDMIISFFHNIKIPH